VAIAITALFLCSLIPLILFLSKQVIIQRRKHQLAYGSLSDDRKLQACMSAQRNCIEYTAIAYLLFLFLSLSHVNTVLIALFNLVFVVGRYTHSYGLLVLEQKKPAQFYGRIMGMAMTLSAISFATIALIYLSILTVIRTM